MEFLIKDATLEDIYDALELIEFKKFMRIEAENINEEDRKKAAEEK